MAAYAYQHLEDLWRSGDLNRLVREFRRYQSEGMLTDEEVRIAKQLLIPSEQRIASLTLPKASKECFNYIQANLQVSREELARMLGLELDRAVKILNEKNYSLKVFKVLVEKLKEIRATA